MKSTLSVVLATFNEEKNLTSCLDSVKDIADEIVIVDGSSTDKTVEIAKKYKAKVKITTNKPNFHINKQMAIEMASKNWILQLDADEHVSDEMKTEIKQILEKDDERVNGYWMPRKNMFLGRFLMKGGQYPDYTLRFYRKGKGNLPQKDVHEQAVVEGKVEYLKSPLLHFPYKNFSHYLKKWDLYNNLFASQIREEQQSKNVFEKLFFGFMYLFVRPSHWLFTTFLRHKGFVDGWQGFIFSFFSALRFPVSYIKYIGWYKFWAILIILFASFLRLYDFNNRWGLGGDDARDAMIALEALKRHELPLMGPFSSAGPFVFGGIYYWFIMLSYIILPFLINAPWVFLEIISIGTVALLIYLGKLIKDEKFALIVGILAAFSPQLVIRALSLGPHTFIATFTVLAFIFLFLLWNKKRVIFSLFLGLSVGLAFSFHYQAINLLILFPAIFFIPSINLKQKFYSFVLMSLGFLIPSLPILYWDYNQNFANINNLMDYFFIAQYRIYVPNSWKLFIFNYISTYWGFVVGNFSFVGFILFALSFITFVYGLLKRMISSKFIFLGIIFAALLFLNRYYRGERSEGYLLYFLPFILIFTAYLFDVLFGFKNKILKLSGILFLILIIVFNFYYILNAISYKNFYNGFKSIAKKLYYAYPDSKFSLYDYKYKMYTTSMPFSLIMNYDNKLTIDGKKIGISCYGKGCVQSLPIINENIPIVDLDYAKNQDLDPKNKIWINVNQSFVYDDLIGWLNKNQLKSTFSLGDYLRNKFNL